MYEINSSRVVLVYPYVQNDLPEARNFQNSKMVPRHHFGNFEPPDPLRFQNALKLLVHPQPPKCPKHTGDTAEERQPHST